jgi:hypothetical protein
MLNWVHPGGWGRGYDRREPPERLAASSSAEGASRGRRSSGARDRGETKGKAGSDQMSLVHERRRGRSTASTARSWSRSTMIRALSVWTRRGRKRYGASSRADTCSTTNAQRSLFRRRNGAPCVATRAARWPFIRAQRPRAWNYRWRRTAGEPRAPGGTRDPRAANGRRRTETNRVRPASSRESPCTLTDQRTKLLLGRILGRFLVRLGLARLARLLRLGLLRLGLARLARLGLSALLRLGLAALRSGLLAALGLDLGAVLVGLMFLDVDSPLLLAFATGGWHVGTI